MAIGVTNGRVVDYDTYVQDKIINGSLPLDNTYYLLVDLINELPNEAERKEFTNRLNIIIEKLPMPLELFVHYLGRDKSSHTGKYYSHSGKSYTLADLILKSGEIKRELFSVYRAIMKKTKKTFALYEGTTTGGLLVG